MPTDGDVWHEFQEKFQSLANEEHTAEVWRNDRWVRAHCDYTDPAPWASALDLPFPPKQECGLWVLSGGASEGLRARFEALATRAGVALDPPQGTTPRDFWLHRLFLDLRENNSDELFAADDKGGIICHVCEASAVFCSRLEKKALETSASTDEDVWNQIDLKLASLRIAGLASEHSEWFKTQQKEIDFKNRNNKNAATVPGELLGLQIEGINRWAESLCHIYAEVWTAQGKEKTPDFVRTVFHKAIVPAIEAKAGSSAYFLSNRAIRTRMPQSILGSRLQELRRAAEKLKADWGRKTETEALELTYKQQSRAATPQVYGPRSKWYESSPGVLKRRQIVLKNPGLNAQSCCKLFDSERIGLPSSWENELNLTTWGAAYKDKKGRARIQRIISTDRNQK